MVEIHIDYEGELHANAVHVPSGAAVATDAPVDNRGRGESFSPTDLVATALGCCVLTIMGIKAEDKGLDIAGTKVTVKKEMSSEPPRRISRLTLDITVPLPGDHADRKVLEACAPTCPVFQSIHPEMEKVMRFHWE